MRKFAVHIGTSGWHYSHWKGPFYPADLPAREFLSYYGGKLRTVEINNSFYQLPRKTTLQMWREAVRPGFIFSMKASRFITHMKKLREPGKPVTQFLKRASALKEKLGPVLFQLPPRWKCNVDRLREFLESLPPGHRYAFELRDPDWFRDEVYDLLEKFNAAFCIYEFDWRLSPRIVTADFVYVRLHGPSGKYQGDYSVDILSRWACDFSEWKRQGKEIYCYFDNDQMGYAVKNAIQLNDMVWSPGRKAGVGLHT